MEKDIKNQSTPNHQPHALDNQAPTQLSAIQAAANNSPRVTQLRALQRAANGGAPIQRNQGQGNISTTEERMVRSRYETRKGAGHTLSKNTITERGKTYTGLYASDPTISMAQNPAFEAQALAWEKQFGSFVYNHDTTNRVVDQAANTVIKYINDKTARQFSKVGSGYKNLPREATYGAMGTAPEDTHIAGAVGPEVNKVKKALKTGNLNTKVTHISNFVKQVLGNDLLNDTDAAKGRLPASTALDEGAERVTTARTTRALTPMKGLAGDQWHMRGRRSAIGADSPANKTVDSVANDGVAISQDEKTHMGVTNNQAPLPYKEGERVWALNERDKWVHSMRQMSLPLKAGVSGTTARTMKGLQILGLNDGALNRLVCIGYLLPLNHHSLVEIMEAAAQNGGPAFVPSQDFYQNIEPFTTQELSTQVGPFPQ